MASLRTYTVELPLPDHSDSSPASRISTAEQSSPIVPYYSSSMPATTAGTTPICSWRLSPSPPLSYPNCSPCCLGLTLQPTPAPFNTSAYNYLPTPMPFRMPASSSVPPANRASPIDAFGAASPGPDFERHNNMQASTSIGLASVASKGSRATSLPEQDNNTSRLVSKYLDSVADHKVRHRPSSNLPIHPIVFSLGGMMNGSTTKVFASWKRVMTRGTYNLMLKRLSLCLLQARVRSFEL